MPKKCQPGVICVENMTMMLITMVIIFLIGYLYLQFKKEQIATNRNHEEDHSHSQSGAWFYKNLLVYNNSKELNKF